MLTTQTPTTHQQLAVTKTLALTFELVSNIFNTALSFNFGGVVLVLFPFIAMAENRIEKYLASP